MTEEQRDHAEEAFNKHIQDTGDGEVEVHQDADGDEYVLVHDAIGSGVDVRVYRNRGIVSLVLIVRVDEPIGPSAEVELTDLENAIHYLTKES